MPSHQSSTHLPPHIDPVAVATERRLLVGELPLASMTRLSAAADAGFEENPGVAECRLLGRIDEAGQRLLEGYVRAGIKLQCQRCMQAVEVVIDTDFLLALIASEDDISRLPAEYEPLIANGDKLVLADLFEDELLLNLPIVARHADETCQIKLGKAVMNKVTVNAVAATDVQKPFAGLDKLLAQGTD
jgi:uncharacterized protein